jgi:hypothetical protein
MIALRVAFASVAAALALAPAWASDNSKSHIDSDVKVYGHADQMSVSDQSSDPTSNDQQVANNSNPSGPDLSQLNQQLVAQQNMLSQAQGALSSAQAQLALAQQTLAAATQAQMAMATSISSAQSTLAAAKKAYALGYGSAATVAQAQAAYDAVSLQVTFSPIAVNDSSGNAVPDNSVPSIGGNATGQTTILAQQAVAQWQQAVAADQVLVARASAMVAQTKAQINAALGLPSQQSPPSQTGDTDTTTTDTASVSDPSNVASASVDGGGAADDGD